MKHSFAIFALACSLSALTACEQDATTTSNGGAASQSASVTASSSSSEVASGAVTSSSQASSTAGGGPCDLGQPTMTSAADCTGYCNKLAEGACPADPSVADCITSCQTEVSYYAPDCEAETVAVVACWAGTTTTASCNADGHASIDGCPAEVQAFNACTACIAAPDASNCSCCEVSTCCVQTSELLHDADFPAYAACREDCNFDPGCWEDCDAMYPDTGADFDQYNYCIGGLCSDACGG